MEHSVERRSTGRCMDGGNDEVMTQQYENPFMRWWLCSSQQPRQWNRHGWPKTTRRLTLACSQYSPPVTADLDRNPPNCPTDDRLGALTVSTPWVYVPRTIRADLQRNWTTRRRIFGRLQ